MKKVLLLLFILVSTLNINAQSLDTTSYYFIRHAEKVRTDKTNKNPNLTEKGKSRAENWSVVFENIDFDYVFSTNYNRTLETAEPTAQKKQLTIQHYNPNNLYNADFKAKTTGKTVLVVGHSNTTPLFVNAILESTKYEQINDNNNANLYIVTIVGTNKNGTLLKIPYSK